MTSEVGLEEISTDVLVIGGGLAGLIAALEAERSGLSVLVLAKFAVGLGTNSSLATSLFTAANASFSEDDHVRATLETGKGLNQFPLVTTLSRNAPRGIETLRGYGVSLSERETGYEVVAPEGAAQWPGVVLMRVLAEATRRSSIRLLPGLTVFDLVVEEGIVRGAFGFSRDGRPILVRAKATLLATGGGGGLYKRNDNQRSILGDGYALGLRAHLPVYDLEFIQCYPLVLAEPRLSTFIVASPYPEEVRLINHRGEDLLEKLGLDTRLNHAILTRRDQLSIFLTESSQEGDVYCDLRQVPEEAWLHHPLNFLVKSKFPFRERPFLVAPAVHFFMGGVEIDPAGKTGLPGLFAAGEVAWGLHGANRHGGNALSECLVYGMLSGQSAVEWVRRGEEPEPFKLSAEALRSKWERRARGYLKKRRGGFDHPAGLLKELKHLAWNYAGPIRDEGSLKTGVSLLEALERKVERIYPATLNDLFRKHELENAVLLIRAILKGSLQREESRGCFYRKDFPNQDDRQWLKSTCYHLEKGELRVTHRPMIEKSAAGSKIPKLDRGP